MGTPYHAYMENITVSENIASVVELLSRIQSYMRIRDQLVRILCAIQSRLQNSDEAVESGRETGTLGTRWMRLTSADVQWIVSYAPVDAKLAQCAQITADLCMSTPCFISFFRFLLFSSRSENRNFFFPLDFSPFAFVFFLPSIQPL